MQHPNLNQAKKATYTNYMDELPTELVESIVPFIQEEEGLLCWVACYKDSKNFGDLPLFLNLGARDIVSSLWPVLHINEPMNLEDCNLIKKLSKYYQEIELTFNCIASSNALKVAKSTRISIIICETELTDENAGLIANCIETFDCFKLALYDETSSEVFLSTKGAILICDALKKSNVEVLDISLIDNDSNEVFISYLAESKISELVFILNEPDVPLSTYIMLADNINLASLQTLKLGFAPNYGVMQIAARLLESSIVHLELSNCNLPTDLDVFTIFCILIARTDLKSLTLSDCDFTDDNAQIMACYIKDWSLIELNITEESLPYYPEESDLIQLLTESGANILINACANSSIKRLNLRSRDYANSDDLMDPHIQEWSSNFE